jgi:HEPN domain-containing protein
MLVLCHQAVEKALKAVMASKNKELPPKIHNLIRLAENAGLLDDMNELQKKTIFTLNPLNIESRYPSYKEKLLAQMTTDTCSQILNNTKELLVWIKAQL